MSRRGNSDRRCPGCRLHDSLCACALIPRIATRTRVILLIHRFEDRKSTNTGRLATACLLNSEIIVRGHAGEPTSAPSWAEGSQPVFLFPHEDAVPLAQLATPERTQARPVTLIVPDGTWRQAFKVRSRVPGLTEVPCASLPIGAPSTYRLRAEPQPGGLATFEAIARAMEILEGPHVRDAMEHVFRVVVERSLWARGSIATEVVTGGIPKGVSRHDPSSGERARIEPEDAPDR